MSLLTDGTVGTTVTPVIDADAHVTEPADLWTSRLPSRWRGRAPHVARDDTGELRWRIGEYWSTPVGFYSQSGWREMYPSVPPDFDEMDPGVFDPAARLSWMDEHGVWAQVLYPNVISFDSSFFKVLDPDLALACVRTYNDFLLEWSSAAPDRLVPIMMVPLWDAARAVEEIHRCADLGFRGMLFGGHLERVGLPPVHDPHWNGVWQAADEHQMSVNFHIGVSVLEAPEAAARALRAREFDFFQVVKSTTLGFANNMSTLCDLILGGVCERFPRLRFVSVESGFGYIPYLLEMLDWQWLGTERPPEYRGRLLPSEYFRRQIYATFWFERASLDLVSAYQDNVMFETDYPHPTSLSPGPASVSPSPREIVHRNLAGLDRGVRDKILFRNAAKLYGIPLPGDGTAGS